MNNAAMLGKINNNFKKALNEQMRDNQFMPAEIITQNGTTYVFGHSGFYKIFLIGRGGLSHTQTQNQQSKGYTGSSGGVSIFTKYFAKNEQYTLTIGNTVKFGSLSPEATPAENSSSSGVGSPGTASGGDMNFNGVSGENVPFNAFSQNHTGADAGCFIPELSKRISALEIKSGNFYAAESGFGIIGYGGGEGLFNGVKSGIKEESAIIIIPLELED